MGADRWQTINDLFHAALAREPHDRDAFLAEACGADAELRDHVGRLVRAHAQSSDFGNAAAVLAASMFPPGDEAAGRECGPYRIVRELGRGGMGAVYLAERADSHFEQRVALKLIKRGMDTDAMLARFRSERQILAFLDHPNIARLLDGGSTKDGLPYLAMELVEGAPIDTYCDQHRLSLDDRLRLFLQVCAAVAYAHQHLVVHRDIKPSNILVGANGSPKLLDFGIAKILHADDAEYTVATEAGLRRLTPEYASPEQVQGLRVTTATDIYSLGVVLYELLSGRALYRFERITQDEIIRTISDTRPMSPSDAAIADDANTPPTPDERAACRSESNAGRLRRRLQGDLDTIVLKALQKEPKRRYLTVEQLAEDLRRHLDGRPVLARPDMLAYRAAKFMRRHKGAVAAGVLVSLSLIAGVIGTAWQARRARHQEQIAKSEQALAQRRFNDVRKLARSVLFDYHDAIKDLPGSTPVRARLVRDALEYLDALANDAGQDQSLQRELASAYARVADVQGGTMFANLGDTPGAIASYRKSVALLEAVIARDQQDRASRRDLAVNRRRLGLLLFETGDVKGARGTSRQALTDLELLAAADPSNDDLGQDFAIAQETVGMILQETGDTKAALDHYRSSQQLLEGILARNTSDPRTRRALSIVHERVGSLLLQTGDLEAALTSNRRGLALRSHLAAEFPLNADYRRTLLVSYYNQGEILATMGRTREALESYRQNGAIAADLLKSDPKNEQYRGDLAYALIRIGDMEALGGDVGSALASYRRSRALRSDDVAQDPGNLWKRCSLIEAHAKIAGALAKARRHDEASAALAGTVALIEQTTIEPTNSNLRAFLATTYAGLGEAQSLLAVAVPAAAARQAGWRLARTMYQRSLELWRDLHDRGIISPSDVARIGAVSSEIRRCDQMLEDMQRQQALKK